MAAKQNPVKNPKSHVKPHASAGKHKAFNKAKDKQAQHAAACQRKGMRLVRGLYR